MTEKKSYKELSKLKTFEERFNYLKLDDKKVGEETFASHRYLNQKLYKSERWKSVRSAVITRDLGRDMGLEGYEIGEGERIIVHHMNPITIEDIEMLRDRIFDPDELISVREKTHNAVHYGSLDTVNDNKVVERKPGDTRLW